MEALMADESGMSAIALVTLLGGAQVAPGTSQHVTFDLQPGNHIALDFGAGPPQIASFTATAGSGLRGFLAGRSRQRRPHRLPVRAA